MYFVCILRINLKIICGSQLFDADFILYFSLLFSSKKDRPKLEIKVRIDFLDDDLFFLFNFYEKIV